jgi:pyruvate dehydrogenase complex dehydrogenase (E1) component
MASQGDREDTNPTETQEWLASLEYILDNEGIERANFLLRRLSSRMTKTGASLPYTITLPGVKDGTYDALDRLIGCKCIQTNQAYFVSLL